MIVLYAISRFSKYQLSSLRGRYYLMYQRRYEPRSNLYSKSSKSGRYISCNWVNSSSVSWEKYLTLASAVSGLPCLKRIIAQ